MRLAITTVLLLLAACSSAPERRGVMLEDLTWTQAESRLTPDAIVVLPLGAASKEHGFHLLLKNDLLLAEYLTERVLERCDVIVVPAITYSYYPKLVEYPGSISLSL